IANYKETQLQNVLAGQPVEVAVDALPGRRFQGRVEEIAPMSGNETSLVPTDNATGNFTKIVQRIPVRIEIQPGQAGLE
ncbi:HlyD family secretion protein, partial [Planococcus sp. SIMBA_160]